MGGKRLGRQTPTVWATLPYKKSKGKDAVKAYEASGRKCQKWQKNLIDIILAEGSDGLWVHSKFGYSVPRRNGKNEVVAMREIYGLLNGEQILHTAHRTTTSTSAAERLVKLLTLSGYEEVVRKKKDDVYDKHFTYSKTIGLEKIKLLDGSEGCCQFRTRTSKGGLGEGFDLLVIDEAQEYTADQDSSLKYLVSDSKNPQTIFCGTPPTAVSSGTVFQEFRADTLAGKSVDAGWAEWSIPEVANTDDVELWYETNPSLGTILTERKILAEKTGDQIDFCIQRLGLWILYNQSSAITKASWELTETDSKPELSGKVFAAVCYEPNGLSTALSLACKTVDGKIFVSTYDCRSRYEGDDWIVNFLKSMKSVEKLAIDGKVGQDSLIERLKDAKLSRLALKPSGGQFVAACAAFERAAMDGTLIHMPQQTVDEVVTNCEKKMYGSGFTYKPLVDGLEMCCMNSLILAHWLCRESKIRKPQQVTMY